MGKTFKDKNGKIENLIEKIKKLHFSTIVESIDEVEQVIRGNLPKDIYGGCEDEISDKEILKCIPLFKTGIDSQVGQVKIYKTNTNEFKVKVHIEDEQGVSSKNQEFIISEPLRVYKVISYIHTNLCYDE